MYSADGKRTNTKEIRYRQKLEKEKHRLIERAMATVPGYKPPQDFKRQTKTVEKIWIPDREYPHINFIGLLIGMHFMHFFFTWNLLQLEECRPTHPPGG
jgi:splicing factor 1